MPNRAVQITARLYILSEVSATKNGSRTARADETLGLKSVVKSVVKSVIVSNVIFLWYERQL